MKFKELELSTKESWVKRNLGSKHFRKTIVAILAGAAVGFLFFYFSEGRHMASIESGDVWRGILTGAFLGFFVTNSPCARGRC